MNLTLFCCLVGSNIPFPVDISSLLAVFHPKDMITEKNSDELKRIDAHELALFEVSLSRGSGGGRYRTLDLTKKLFFSIDWRGRPSMSR
ncbi:hypothetical protein K435DRAFT_444520 [Dendrothele bispora CBS 962.96]|uniref:Crinkler effector protein N-terminal domain-containing protein n=1 Tax=Dendrothele bispora (strain CBS 962.96) TaxID=1314807 RepID=A0A4S8L2H2_DENBC|nr:hypothetical protein K435DRAFT_444520 [Dendrothele bispora CBS 962.96]